MYERTEKSLTQILNEPEHDTSDVQITFDPEGSFHLEVGDVDSQCPRSIADQLAVGHHLGSRFLFPLVGENKQNTERSKIC
jgi:hypothetical protein